MGRLMQQQTEQVDKEDTVKKELTVFDPLCFWKKDKLSFEQLY